MLTKEQQDLLLILVNILSVLNILLILYTIFKVKNLITTELSCTEKNIEKLFKNILRDLDLRRKLEYENNELKKSRIIKIFKRIFF